MLRTKQSTPFIGSVECSSARTTNLASSKAGEKTGRRSLCFSFAAVFVFFLSLAVSSLKAQQVSITQTTADQIQLLQPQPSIYRR